MPTTRGWAALGVAAALVMLWAAFGEIELLGTALFLVTATLLGVAFVRYGTPRVNIVRRIYPTQAHEGDGVVIEIDLVAVRRASNLIMEDSVHGLGVARFAAARSAAHQPLTGRYEVLCRSRGVYPVGPAIVGVGDPFGLAARNVTTGSPGRLTVFPRIEDLAGFPAVRGRDGSTQSTRPAFAPQGGEDFFTLREYQVGDDLRKVHWPSSAKRDQLMIKQLDIPWQAKALVLLDQRAGRYPTTDHFEQAVRGAASVVSHLYRGGYSPELWAGERAPGLRSGSRFTQAMELLASIQPSAHLDLRAAVTRLRRTGVGGGSLVIVTGTPDEEVLAAHRVLAADFTRTVVMAVTAPSDDMLPAFRRAGTITVDVGPEAHWGPAWRTAMELSWSTASVG